MLKYGVGLIVRAFVETGLVFVVAGLALLAVAYRIARLFVTPEPDRLDLLAARLGRALGLAAVAREAAADVELEDDDEPPEDFYGEVDWRQLVI